MSEKDRSPDGGVVQEPEKGEADEFEVDVEFPEDSIFTRDEYLEMYHVAADEPAFSILMALQAQDRLSASELAELVDREANGLHYHLRKLKEHALIVNRRKPSSGTEEPYSYYELTDLGHVVLSKGLAEGVRELANREGTFSDQFS